MTHDDAHNVTQTLGTDDAAKMREKTRWMVLMYPPMKSSTSCRAAAPVEAHSAGYRNGQICSTSTVVDNDRLQRNLAEIDRQK
jgi:hypothetical protein